jgi:hypothetical protein
LNCQFLATSDGKQYHAKTTKYAKALMLSVTTYGGKITEFKSSIPHSSELPPDVFPKPSMLTNIIIDTVITKNMMTNSKILEEEEIDATSIFRISYMSNERLVMNRENLKSITVDPKHLHKTASGLYNHENSLDHRGNSVWTVRDLTNPVYAPEKVYCNEFGPVDFSDYEELLADLTAEKINKITTRTVNE